VVEVEIAASASVDHLTHDRLAVTNSIDELTKARSKLSTQVDDLQAEINCTTENQTRKEGQIEQEKLKIDEIRTKLHKKSKMKAKMESEWTHAMPRVSCGVAMRDVTHPFVPVYLSVCPEELASLQHDIDVDDGNITLAEKRLASAMSAVQALTDIIRTTKTENKSVRVRNIAVGDDSLMCFVLTLSTCWAACPVRSDLSFAKFACSTLIASS
jgi:predicted RNase H-like nuclease (RuvC/YqgF family)